MWSQLAEAEASARATADKRAVATGENTAQASSGPMANSTSSERLDTRSVAKAAAIQPTANHIPRVTALERSTDVRLTRQSGRCELTPASMAEHRGSHHRFLTPRRAEGEWPAQVL